MADRLTGVAWQGQFDGELVLLDQTQLPGAVVHRTITDIDALRTAIIELAVRGAPAIGIAAAYGVVLHLRAALPAAGGDVFKLEDPLDHAIERLGSSRPTAVNLHWALARMRDCFDTHPGLLAPSEMVARLLMEARRIENEDRKLCDAIAKAGAALLPNQGTIYTHCNTGSLATAGVGTALGCIRQAIAEGKKLSVIAGETRPLLQGARLTAMELHHEGIEVTLCCDNAAASLMGRGKVDAIIVGADRITANGDTANKIGTYGLAVLARHHGIPFYVAAPYSTFDLTLASGSAIEIEERDGDEVRAPQGTAFAPADIPVANPAFDVTPAELISAIITERGVIEQPTTASVTALMQNASLPPAV